VAQYIRYLLVAGISMIAITGLIGVFAVVFGKFDDFQFKVLMTLFVIGFYSFTLAATLGNGKEYLVLGTIGALLASLGLMLTLPFIWTWSNDAPTKAILSITLLAFSFAHGTMNYRLSSSTMISVIVMSVANLMVLLVSVMLLTLVLGDFKNISDGFLRTLIGLGILDVVFTIISPMVTKFTRTYVSNA
jgi:hypothetical protein